MLQRVAAVLFAALTGVVVAFQLALAAGAPWGAYAMGGSFTGAFPPALRVAALLQAALLVVIALVVLSRAGVTLSSWTKTSRWAIWLVVAFYSVSLLLNLITPSAGERMIWAPVVAVLLTCSLVVAIAGNQIGGRKRA